MADKSVLAKINNAKRMVHEYKNGGKDVKGTRSAIAFLNSHGVTTDLVLPPSPRRPKKKRHDPKVSLRRQLRDARRRVKYLEEYIKGRVASIEGAEQQIVRLNERIGRDTTEIEESEMALPIARRNVQNLEQRIKDDNKNKSDVDAELCPTQP